MEYAYQTFSSPVGLLHIYADHSGLKHISFDEALSIKTLPPNSLTRSAHLELEGYFLGEIKEFKVPLNPDGSDFQKDVWSFLQGIPYGKTTSYQTIAQLIGGKEKVRAVASANSKNPIPIIIPCHRVIGKDGELTGYSGGLQRKEALLALESGELQGRLF